MKESQHSAAMARPFKRSTFKARLVAIQRALWEIEGALPYGPASGREGRRSPFSRPRLCVLICTDVISKASGDGIQ
jgi:hypothetical protein